MNEQSIRIFRSGLFFAAIVVFVDFFLIPYPVLNWLALGVLFFLFAVMIFESMSNHIRGKKSSAQPLAAAPDELQWLDSLVDAAINKRYPESAGMLVERLGSIALSTVSAGTSLSRREVQELVRRNSSEIRQIVKDERMLRLLAGDLPPPRDRGQLEELLRMIEVWSR